MTVNNHFVDDSLLSIQVNQESMYFSTWDFFSIFCKEYGSKIGDHKTKYWLIGIDEPPKWIPLSWNFTHPTTMWNLCLDHLQPKLLLWNNKDLPFAAKSTIISRIL